MARGDRKAGSGVAALLARAGRAIVSFASAPESVPVPDRQVSATFGVALLLLIAFGIGGIASDTAAWAVRRTGGTDIVVSVCALAIIVVSFALNRAGRFTLAAHLTVWTATLAIFATSVPSPSGDDLGMLYFLVIPLLLAGILLTVRATAMIAAACVAGTVLLDLLLPSVPDGGIPVFTVLIISASSLVATHFRSKIEAGRRRALEASEERFRSLVAHAPEAILLLDGDGRTVVEANERAERLFGVSREELLTTGIGRGEPDGDTLPLDRLQRGVADALTGKEAAFDLECRRRGGAVTACEVRLVRLPSEPRALVRASFTDVTERRQAEAQLRYVASHDMLTMLPNRELFDDLLARGISRARRGQSRLAVVFVDVDGFKTVNDAFSHRHGDILLHEVARRLTSCLRESDTVARRGGDEFSILLEDLSGPLGAIPVITKISAAVAAPYLIEEREVFITASFGIAMYPDDGENPDTLLQNADTALYQAKSDGKNTYRFYSVNMTKRALERLSLAARLRGALDRGEISLAYQPQVQIATGRVVGLEALARWRLPDLGEVSPGIFIPIAEETGLILGLGSWILRAASRDLAALSAAGHRSVSVSVNVSGRELRTGRFGATVRDALQESGAPPERLVLELTENIVFHVAGASADALREMRDAGAGLAVDDFGTGFSTLWQLSRLPLDELKIDRRFADGIAERGGDEAIVAGILGIADRLGLRSVAEGVENSTQLGHFHRLGCGVVQGFYYSPPCPRETWPDLLRRGRFPRAP